MGKKLSKWQQRVIQNINNGQMQKGNNYTKSNTVSKYTNTSNSRNGIRVYNKLTSKYIFIPSVFTAISHKIINKEKLTISYLKSILDILYSYKILQDSPDYYAQSGYNNPISSSFTHKTYYSELDILIHKFEIFTQTKGIFIASKV